MVRPVTHQAVPKGNDVERRGDGQRRGGEGCHSSCTSSRSIERGGTLIEENERGRWKRGEGEGERYLAAVPAPVVLGLVDDLGAHHALLDLH